MKILKYPIAVAIVAMLIYVGLVRSGYKIPAESTPTAVIEMHTVNAHSRVENAHSTVESTQSIICKVNTGVPDGYLNLRSGSGLEHSVVVVLNEGDELEYLGLNENGFLKVSLSDKYEGWVREAFVSCE